MPFYHLVFTVCAAVCLYFVFVCISALSSPLRSVPGSLLARVTNLPYLISTWKGHAQHDTIRLHRQYAPPGAYFAPVVRLAPNLYSIARPEKAVYGVSAKMSKGSWYEAFKHPHPDRGTLGTERNISRHTSTRRKFQALFSLSHLLQYESLVDSAQDVFRKRLEEMARGERGQWINLHHWVHCYTFDVIGNITYGRRFGFLDAGEDIEDCMATIRSALFYSCLTGIYSWIHPFLYRFLEYIPGSGAEGRLRMMRLVGGRLEERRRKRAAAAAALSLHGESCSTKTQPATTSDDVDEAKTPRDFLDVMLDAQLDTKQGITPYHVFMIGLANVTAGSDTTAVSLSSVLYHLLRNPHTLNRLREELDTAIRAGRMTADRLAYRVSQELPYLQACIKESLRLCSATALPFWRTVPPGGAQIAGHYFPAGVDVGINAWVPHSDRDVWGPDTEAFRPERWIEADAEKLRFMEAHYVTFGLGSRTCIGKHVAYLQMCKVIPMIVSSFDFDMQHPDQDWETLNYWFVRPTNFHVSVRMRENSEKPRS